MSIDVSRLGPAAQKQVREKLAAQKKERIAAAQSEPRNDRKNKLNAQKTDGYDSKKEAERAAELRWLEKAGKIRDLREQVKFVLLPAKYEEIPRIGKRGKPVKPKRRCIERGLSYVADFVYTDNETGHTVVEDVKGYKGGATYQIFINKRKLMLEIYGIKVVEV
jgi:regulator of protease activity HflC (stomatin/prohibitin superfamily)